MECLGRLAGGIAHDINNLLTVINGYSSWLLRDLHTGDPIRPGLEEIHRAGERAADLTRQLLDLSRENRLQPRAVSLNRLLEELRPTLPGLLREQVSLRMQLGAANDCVYADPHRLEQVVMNLAANARDAMPDGGLLLLQTDDVYLDRDALGHSGMTPGSYVLLTARDNGTGMDEETRRRIFEPFYTTKERGKGTGLGLSVVDEVVTQSGGHVDVETAVGKGTTFRIYFPRRLQPDHDAPAPAPLSVRGGRESVLVVEDMPEVRSLVANILEGYGYNVLTAENGETALALCASTSKPLDLILTDIIMPGMNGLELARKVKEREPRSKVLLMSGYATVPIPGESLDPDMHLMQKPFSPEALAAKVRSVIGPSRMPARIVVADDDAGVRNLLNELLTAAGYEIVEARDGKEAFRRARTEPVDLVITDIVMPVQEGLETIRALHREVPDVGVIAISGADRDAYLKTARLLGASAALAKPVDPDELLQVVRETLRSLGRE
jgi:CheY-like chemotaxis protein